MIPMATREPSTTEGGGGENDVLKATPFKQASVWEIWDRDDNYACWFVEGCSFVLDRQQWEDSPARRAGIGDPFLRPVDHERGRAGTDAGRAPRAARAAVATGDDIRKLGPPHSGVVEVPRGQLVAQRQDLGRLSDGPPDDDGAHAPMIAVNCLRRARPPPGTRAAGRFLVSGPRLVRARGRGARARGRS